MQQVSEKLEQKIIVEAKLKLDIARKKRKQAHLEVKSAAIIQKTFRGRKCRNSLAGKQVKSVLENFQKGQKSFLRRLSCEVGTKSFKFSALGRGVLEALALSIGTAAL
eukprot:snap_masked-scaffold_5-processed-gene-7.22-mRNA-1 protein AED:1.00 eAED:1.00 QI:0/0/0/0/1/1/2/0/107